MNFREDIRHQFTIAGILCLAPSKIFEGLSNAYTKTSKVSGTNRLAVTLGLGFAWLGMVAATVVLPIVYIAIMLPATIVKHAGLFAYTKLSNLYKTLANLKNIFRKGTSKAATEENVSSTAAPANQISCDNEPTYSASNPRPRVEKKPVIFSGDFSISDTATTIDEQTIDERAIDEQTIDDAKNDNTAIKRSATPEFCI